METLIQPIFTNHPEKGHELKDVITIQEFINLLKEEEDYWPGEQNNTKLMITRLRKIFYDAWGWNSELIRGAASIEMRYEVKIVDVPTENSREVVRYEQYQYAPKNREVLYTNHDRVYGSSRAGQAPFIYKNDHQEVLLPDGYYCDAAHILAGLDAYNYEAVVSPLPKFLSFLNFLVPHVDSNMDIVTWLGDIASSSGSFLFDYLFSKKQHINIHKDQEDIYIDAPGSDMLGDIDPYVIRQFYDVSSTSGVRYTDILQDYFCGDTSYRTRRISTYCNAVGLTGWNGQQFSNEQEWLKKYTKQLKANTEFQVFSLTSEKLPAVILPLKIYFGFYKDVLKLEYLLQIYLNALKEQMKNEPIK